MDWACKDMDCSCTVLYSYTVVSTSYDRTGRCCVLDRTRARPMAVPVGGPHGRPALRMYRTPLRPAACALTQDLAPSLGQCRRMIGLALLAAAATCTSPRAKSRRRLQQGPKQHVPRVDNAGQAVMQTVCNLRPDDRAVRKRLHPRFQCDVAIRSRVTHCKGIKEGDPSWCHSVEDGCNEPVLPLYVLPAVWTGRWLVPCR